MENKKLIKIELTIQEIWSASKTKIIKNKKNILENKNISHVWLIKIRMLYLQSNNK